MVGGASDVSAWTGQCCGSANPNRISDQLRDDRNRRGGLACRGSGRATVGRDDIDIHRDKFSGKSRKAIELSFGESRFEDDVFALNIAQPGKFSLEQCELRTGHPILEHAYAIDFRGLLSLRGASSKGNYGRYERK